MNPEWVRIRSWHIVTFVISAGVKTRCGRIVANGSVVADLPANVKTCETCLRLVATDQERRA